MPRTYAITNQSTKLSRISRTRHHLLNPLRCGVLSGYRKAIVCGAVGVALIGATVAGASAIGHDNSTSTSLQSRDTVSQSGTWTVPTNEANAPAVPTPGGAQLGSGGFNALTCPTSSECVAVGGDANLDGVVATSSDGGTTWSTESVETDQPELNAVTCSSASDCVAAGVGDVITSSDGGRTWKSVSIPTAKTTLLGVACPSALTCVAVGVSPVQASSYAGEIVVSSDGGSTWSTPQIPASIGALGSVDCPSSTFCVAVGNGILVSSDGGESWTPEHVAGGTGVLRNVSCSSSSECVAIGPNPTGTLDPTAAAFGVVTSDGGSTWSSVTMPADSFSLNALTCATNGPCIAGGLVATGSAPLATSADGGRTWTASNPPPNVSAIAGVSCQSSTSCVFVGLEGSSAVTGVTTDGSTWRVSPVTAIATTTTEVPQ